MAAKRHVCGTACLRCQTCEPTRRSVFARPCTAETGIGVYTLSMAKSKSSKRKSRSHDSLQQVEEAQVLDRVSFRLRSRESVLGWTLAAYTAWIGIVAAPGQWMPWIGVFVAGFVAAWARLSPALRPGKVALRYSLLVVMGVLLMADPQLGSSTGYMLFWPLAICCAATLMLRERWAMVVVVA